MAPTARTHLTSYQYFDSSLARAAVVFCEMIFVLLKKCAKCKRLIPYGKAYCPECEVKAQEKKKERQQKSNSKYDKNNRNGRSREFYKGTAWKALSASYMQEKGYKCERCGAIATQVHHKNYISTPEGWKHRLDKSNLEALCLKCHNAEHDRFRTRKG